MDKVDFDCVLLHVWMLMAQTTDLTGKYERGGGTEGEGETASVFIFNEERDS